MLAHDACIAAQKVPVTGAKASRLRVLLVAGLILLTLLALWLAVAGARPNPEIVHLDRFLGIGSNRARLIAQVDLERRESAVASGRPVTVPDEDPLEPGVKR